MNTKPCSECGEVCSLPCHRCLPLFVVGVIQREMSYEIRSLDPITAAKSAWTLLCRTEHLPKDPTFVVRSKGSGAEWHISFRDHTISMVKTSDGDASAVVILDEKERVLQKVKEIDAAPVDYADDIVWELVRAELAKARAKFPGGRHTLAALTEEVGELATEFLKKNPAGILSEAVQVIAMGFRCAVEGDNSFELHDGGDKYNRKG